MAPLGTAPRRIAPGVWVTSGGRQLSDAGSAYWEHHFKAGTADGRGHVAHPALTHPLLAPHDALHPRPTQTSIAGQLGRSGTTHKEWEKKTPAQQMGTKVAVWDPKTRRTYAVPVGFKGASSVEQQMAARKAAAAAAGRAWLAQRKKFDTLVKMGQLSPQEADEATRQNLAHPKKGGFLSHTGLPAAAHGLHVARGLADAAAAGLSHSVMNAVGLDPSRLGFAPAPPKSGMMGGLPGVSAGTLARTGSIEEKAAAAYTSQDLVNILKGQGKVTPLGTALGLASLVPGAKGMKVGEDIVWAAKAGRAAEHAATAGGDAARVALQGKIVENVGRQQEINKAMAAGQTGFKPEMDALMKERAALLTDLENHDARVLYQHPAGGEAAPAPHLPEHVPTALAPGEIPERQGLINAWKQSGFTDDQVNRVAAFYDNQAHHSRGGPAAWWRNKIGARTGETQAQVAARARTLFQRAHIPETPQAARLRAKARTAKFKATDADVDAATQLPRNEEGLGVLYPEGVHTPPMGRMPRIKGMTPMLWDLIKRGAPYRDWYERGSGVIARFAERQGLSNRQAAAIVAITSQSANPTFNLKRAAEMVGEYKTLGRIEPSTRFAGQAEKVTHVLEHPETFNWDGVKTNNYFANFIHHLDPEFHAQMYGADTQVTVDRHIANMILGKKSVTEAQSNEVGDLFVRTAKNLGWTPKEVQAAAWVPWKAEQMDITQTLKVLSKQMAQRGEIPKELLGPGKKISDKRTAFVRAAYEGGRHPEDHIPKGWEHYKHTAADAYGKAERMYSGEFGGTLYQGGARPASELPKGATEFFKDGSRVHHWESGDVSTAMHELLHVSIHDLKGRHLNTLADEFAGGKALVDWTDTEHEAVASAFEQWIRTGEITNKKLVGPFNAIKQWMINLLPKARAEGMVPKDVEDAFNYMFREQPPVKLEEQVAAAAKRAPAVYDVQGVKRSLDLSERVAKMTAAEEEAGGGIAGQRAQLEALRGEYHKEPFDDLTHLTEDDLDHLAHSVAATNLRRLEKVTLVKGIEAAQKGDVFTPSVTRLALKAFAPGEPLAGRTAKETAVWLINEIVNIPRSIMASGDASGAFRQALVAFALHPVMVTKEMGPMFHYLASEKAYLKNQEWLATDPKARLMAAHGTDFTDVHHGFENREEQFTSSFAEWITGGKHGLVRRSGRAYTGLLNNVRYALNEDMYRIAAKQNIDLGTQELRDISTVANWATGRGHLGGYETQKMLLNTFLFSPRLLKSRLDMLNPFFYRRLSPIAKRQAQRATAQLVLGGVAVLGMAKLSGVDVGIDPFSSDFGKMKIGNHRFDIWGGHQQVVRTIAQEMFGKKTKVTTGETLGISRGLPTLNFARGKLSPPIGLFVDKATGSTIIGDPLTWKGVLWNHLSPLGVQDAVEAYQDKGGDENSIPWGLGAFGAAFMGVGAQTIPDKTQGSDSGYKPPSVSSSGGYQPPSLSGGGGYQPPG